MSISTVNICLCELTFQGNSRRNQGVFVRRLRLQYLQEAHARQAHETSALGLGKRHHAQWSRRAGDGGT